MPARLEMELGCKCWLALEALHRARLRDAKRHVLRGGEGWGGAEEKE